MVFQIDSKNDSPRASVNEFLSQDGINPTGGSATSNNGLNGYEATATAKTQQGQEVRLYLYSVEYDGNIYRYLAYSSAEQFDNYNQTFVNTTNGFDRLNDSSILNIEPVRLNTLRANRTASFQSFMPDNMPLDMSEEDVAIANQVELNETIEEGTWIKIPRQ
jgi:predicted Zn-dependent protease